jgi:glycosyltransferase involved in cell wall biosynthesis
MSLKFSIIIPTYNRANFIVSTIHSALNQTYSDLEIIIVDDGSTDNTKEVVSLINDSRVIYFRKENAERGAARNFGINKATGDYITFLDSDDLLYPDYLKNAFDCIVNYNRPPFLHLAYEIKSVSGKVLSRMDNIKSNDVNQIIYGNPFSCIGSLVRFDVFQTHRFIEDRNLAGSEDWEFWMRIVANFGIKACNKVSAAMIQHHNRSVMSASEEKLRLRKELALTYAFKDKEVERLFAKHYKKMESFADSYIALHLILAKNYKQGIKYLLSSIRMYPLSVFSRRFLAILKHLVLR